MAILIDSFRPNYDLQLQWGGWKAGVIGGLGSRPFVDLRESLSCAQILGLHARDECCISVLSAPEVFHSCSQDASGQYWTTRSVWQAPSVCLYFLSPFLSPWSLDSLILGILTVLGDAFVLLLHLLLSVIYSLCSTIMLFFYSIKNHFSFSVPFFLSHLYSLLFISF